MSINVQLQIHFHIMNGAKSAIDTEPITNFGHENSILAICKQLIFRAKHAKTDLFLQHLDFTKHNQIQTDSIYSEH